MKTVRKIEANKPITTNKQKFRVAAYCRVSTDNDDQLESLETQKAHYESWIKLHSEWEYAGLYYDSGITGTKSDVREGLQNLLQACRLGRIDRILVKSISRFSRNTTDCLSIVRELLEIGVTISFEKESINTMDAKGEVLITIMASLAQQESESLSQNVKLGMQYRFQQGKVMVNARCFLGYDKDENGHLVINPEQAEVVKRIYREYLEGASCQQIARGLEHDGVLTARGNKRWHDSAIRLILENEKYMGDALLQKTYTVDFLRKKRIKNNGEMPQYYVEDDHEAIIPKELFLKVQEEIARRGSQVDCMGRRRGFSSKHCFTNLMYCAECGEPFRRVHWNNRGCKSIVWRCTSRLDKKGECHARTIYEDVLKQAFVTALNQLIGSSMELGILQENIAEVLRMGSPDSAENIQAQLDELQRQLIERASRREDYDDISQEIFRLREQKEKAMMDDVSRSDYFERIKELQDFIISQPSGITEFDETLVKHLLSKVTVFEEKLVFEFKSGVSVEVEN